MLRTSCGLETVPRVDRPEMTCAKITLIRHGRPTADFKARITGSEFAEWLRAYDRAGIDPSLPPPRALVSSLKTCALVLTSPAVRAIESAKMLGLSAPREIRSDAAEAPLPIRIFCPISVRPGSLTVLARVWWLLGVARASESKAQVRCRATKLANVLSSRASERGHVALVAHGFLIRFLHSALEASGWQCSTGRDFGYWSSSHFERAFPACAWRRRIHLRSSAQGLPLPSNHCPAR